MSSPRSFRRCAHVANLDFEHLPRDKFVENHPGVLHDPLITPRPKKHTELAVSLAEDGSCDLGGFGGVFGSRHLCQYPDFARSRSIAGPGRGQSIAPKGRAAGGGRGRGSARNPPRRRPPGAAEGGRRGQKMWRNDGFFKKPHSLGNRSRAPSGRPRGGRLHRRAAGDSTVARRVSPPSTTEKPQLGSLRLYITYIIVFYWKSISRLRFKSPGKSSDSVDSDDDSLKQEAVLRFALNNDGHARSLHQTA